MHTQSLSRVRLCNPWISICQAPLSWDFSGKNTGVGCHFLLQGIFLTQDLNLHLLHWQVDSLPLSHQGSPLVTIAYQFQHFFFKFYQNHSQFGGMHDKAFIFCTCMNLARDFLFSHAGTQTYVKTCRMSVNRKGGSHTYNFASFFINICLLVITLYATEGKDKRFITLGQNLIQNIQKQNVKGLVNSFKD